MVDPIDVGRQQQCQLRQDELTRKQQMHAYDFTQRQKIKCAIQILDVF